MKFVGLALLLLGGLGLPASWPSRWSLIAIYLIVVGLVLLLLSDEYGNPYLPKLKHRKKRDPTTPSMKQVTNLLVSQKRRIGLSLVFAGATVALTALGTALWGFRSVLTLIIGLTGFVMFITGVLVGASSE